MNGKHCRKPHFRNGVIDIFLRYVRAVFITNFLTKNGVSTYILAISWATFIWIPLQHFFYPIVYPFFTQIAALDKKAVDIAADESSKGPLKKKEIEIVTKATIEKYHSQYVDICRWNPKNEMFVTASTDKKAFWWHCKVWRN